MNGNRGENNARSGGKDFSDSYRDFVRKLAHKCILAISRGCISENSYTSRVSVDPIYQCSGIINDSSAILMQVMILKSCRNVVSCNFLCSIFKSLLDIII